MLTDSTGLAPEWHHWIRSGLAVAVGIALVSTGVFTPLGGALIGMGVNSMISGYISGSSGGNFDSGYYGGAITGFICGGAAGVGGVLFSSGGGAVGGLLGTLYTDVSNTGKTNISNALLNAGIYATMNVFIGVGSAITSQLMYTGQRTVVGGFTFAAEGIIDAATVIVNEIYERIN